MARDIQPQSKRKRTSPAEQHRRSARLSNRLDFNNSNGNGNVNDKDISHQDVSGRSTEIVVCLPISQMPEANQKKKTKKKKTVISKNAVSESDSDKGYREQEDEEEEDKCLKTGRTYKKKEKEKKKKGVALLGGSSFQGWSEEQDIALHNAYYTVKPVPNFWKQIAKLVPGKSSEECFNRFYTAFPTPPVSQPRSRTKGKIYESSVRPFVDDINTLLKSAGSTGGRSGRTKNCFLDAHKTVRQILGRHKIADKEYETDLFSAVETFRSSSQSFLIPIADAPITPDCAHKPGGESSFYRTQSAHWHKSLSRFSEDSHRQLQKKLVSPEVLKQVKNPALHDKYIDLLHSRDALRNALAQNIKIESKYVGTGMGRLPQAEAVCAAKTAVVAEAQQVLRQSRTLGEKDCLRIGYCTSDDSDEECEGDNDGEVEI
ncbi:hypothetical protein KI387_013090 [Taxus chinensis]|uniref:Myb-like domain-containing protein n=1 Tax=Taxus chinensis TaxID=29808 RepID=A0AA38CQ63_TAXCH|nr:hypothetical protein KI387_013090 [Taxus chinensis]